MEKKFKVALTYPYKIKDVDNNEFVFAYIENETPVYKGNRGIKHVFDIDKYIIIENEKERKQND